MSNPFIRQLDLFNPDEFNLYGVNIVGSGSIGSVLSICLAKIGIKKFILWDDDKIEDHNISNQFFNSERVGEYKSYNIRDRIINQSPIKYKVSAQAINQKLTENNNLCYPIVFSCVDSITARKLILKVALKSGCLLLIDGRMNGKVFQIYTINLTDKKAIEEYKKTFYEDQQQHCSDRSVIYNVFGISSLMVNQLTKVLQNKPYPFEISFCFENYILNKRGLESE